MYTRAPRSSMSSRAFSAGCFHGPRKGSVLRLRSYEDREGQKRNVTEAVVTTLRFLGPSQNGNGPKATESSKPAEPADEGDNPFNEPGSETTDQEIPF